MAKKILLVSNDHFNIEHWEKDLSPQGYDCASVGTMVEALDYLQKNPNTPMLVQDGLPIIPVEPELRQYPPEFNSPDHYDRGVALIQYARKQQLIDSATPAHIATVMIPREKYPEPPEGVTGVIRLEGDRITASQLQPAHLPAGHGSASISR